MTKATKSEVNKTPEITGKDLIGLTIKINYAKISVFFDRINNIYIGLDYNENKNSFTITEEFKDISNILKSLNNNKIYLFKDDKDVSEKFGGKAFKKYDNEKPSVVKIEPIVIKETDKPFLNILYQNNIQKVISSITNYKNEKDLQRIKELEEAGMNNFLKGRSAILDFIYAYIEEIKK